MLATEIKTHEELISMAYEAYRRSNLDQSLSDTQIVEKLRIMNDGFLQGFIQSYS